MPPAFRSGRTVRSELYPEEVARIAAVLHGCLSKTPVFAGVDELARAIAPTAG